MAGHEAPAKFRFSSDKRSFSCRKLTRKKKKHMEIHMSQQESWWKFNKETAILVSPKKVASGFFWNNFAASFCLTLPIVKVQGWKPKKTAVDSKHSNHAVGVPRWKDLELQFQISQNVVTLGTGFHDGCSCWGKWLSTMAIMTLLTGFSTPYQFCIAHGLCESLVTCYTTIWGDVTLSVVCRNNVSAKYKV